MASGVQRAALALYARDFSGKEIVAGSYLQIALSLAGFGLMKTFGDIISGDYSDKHGRRIMIIAGTITYLFGALVIVSFRYFEFLTIGNALLGAGEGLIFAAAVAILVDLGGSKERATSVGLFEFSVYMGYSIGSMITGIIMETAVAEKDFQVPFYFTAFISIIPVVIAFLTIRETSDFCISNNCIDTTIQEIEEVKIEEVKKSSKYHSNLTLIVSFMNGHLGKIADALINCKKLIIEGGSIHFKNNLVKCLDCGQTVEMSIYEEPHLKCLACGSLKLKNLAFQFGHGKCCRNRFGKKF